VKRLNLLMMLGLLAVSAASASAQQIDQPPMLDMHRLYQVVGYLYNLDPDLLRAIATAESGGNPYAVSPKGAQGLMQLMPGTARQYRVDHPFDPVENVFGAARFLTGLRAWSQLQAPFGEVDLPAMIAAYNAGPGAVEKYGGIPPYAETQTYVRRVLWLYLLGTPIPRGMNPMHSSGKTGYEYVPAVPVAAPSLRRTGANPSRRASRPRSVFDQLAEIKRQRAQAKSQESAARAELNQN
jgi:hypothetical protein